MSLVQAPDEQRNNEQLCADLLESGLSSDMGLMEEFISSQEARKTALKNEKLHGRRHQSTVSRLARLIKILIMKSAAHWRPMSDLTSHALSDWTELMDLDQPQQC